MAYAGYLIKVGTYTIPLSILRAETYSPYKSTTDLDSQVDGNGVLHRNALEHIAYKIEFETIPLLTDSQFGDLMRNIQSQYTVPLEKKASVTAYIPELDDYITQDMYMPDIKPVLYYADEHIVQYEQIRLAFMGY